QVRAGTTGSVREPRQLRHVCKGRYHSKVAALERVDAPTNIAAGLVSMALAGIADPGTRRIEVTQKEHDLAASVGGVGASIWRRLEQPVACFSARDIVGTAGLARIPVASGFIKVQPVRIRIAIDRRASDTDIRHRPLLS